MAEGKYPPNLEAEHKARYAFAAPFCRNKRILDVACGTGYGGQILSEADPSEVVQCDKSLEAVAETKRRQEAQGMMCCLVDAMCLPFKPEQFQVCVTFETLEHLGRPEAFVSELYRVCVNKGLLILSTPNRRVVSPGTSPGGKPRNPFHVREFLLRELSSLLESKGFSVLAVYGQHQESLIRAYGWDIVSRYPVLKASVQRLVRLIRGAQTAKRDGFLAPTAPQSPVVEPLRLLRQPEYFVVCALKRKPAEKNPKGLEERAPLAQSGAVRL